MDGILSHLQIPFALCLNISKKEFSNVIQYRPTSEIQRQTLNTSHLVEALKINAGLLFIGKKKVEPFTPPFPE